MKDKNGKIYDIEMQAVNEYNLPKRMRYYQAAVDVLFLDKEEHYSSLNDSFIQKIEQRIKEVKGSEKLRREYMLINIFERDAHHEGWKDGLAQGAYQNKLETAKNLLGIGLSEENISKATGLSIREIEAL